MSGPYDPSDDDQLSRPYRQPDADEAAAASPRSSSSGSPIDRAALEQALQETLTAASSGAPIDPAEMDAIRGVVSRYKSSEMSLDIAAHLVQAVLATHFRQLQAGESFWQTVSRDIARTLCDDPHTEARLNTLWQRLKKVSS